MKPPLDLSSGKFVTRNGKAAFFVGTKKHSLYPLVWTREEVSGEHGTPFATMANGCFYSTGEPSSSDVIEANRDIPISYSLVESLGLYPEGARFQLVAGFDLARCQNNPDRYRVLGSVEIRVSPEGKIRSINL